MSVETVAVELSVPKEMKDVVDLADAVLEKVLSKAEASSYLDLVDDLAKAGDGVGQLSEEAKSEHRSDLVAYLVHKLLDRLVPGAPAAPEPPEAA